MVFNFFLKRSIFIIFLIFFLSPACIKYYEDDFQEDIFSLPNHWYRVASNHKQVFINSDQKLEILFHDEKYCGAAYRFPFYSSEGIYEISFCAKSDKENGRLLIYGYTNDYNKNILLGEKILPVSNKFTDFKLSVKMPPEGFNIELLLTKDNRNTDKGRLLVEFIKITHKLFSSTLDESHIEKNDYCLPYRKWERWQASENQAFINSDGIMILKFDENKWISVHYQLPYYKGNQVISLKFSSYAVEQKGKIVVYDYTVKKSLASKVIGISKDFNKYCVKFKTPEQEDHAIWVRFVQKSYNETGGSLFINNIKVNNKILDIVL